MSNFKAFLHSSIQRIIEISDQPWTTVHTSGFFLCTLIALFITYFSNLGHQWIPLLDGANLLFHEAGHPFFGLFWDRLAVYGGTFGQLVFPTVTLITFWKKREVFSFFISCVWIIQNLWNISRYMADARAQVLPLVGSGDHDWQIIFNQWNVLEKDVLIAGRLRFLGGVAMICVWWWLFKQWRRINNG